MNKLLRRFVLVVLLGAHAMAWAQPSQLESEPSGSVGAPEEGYRVRPGDTLWDIAETYLGDALAWPRLRDLNQVSDPLRLQPETNLILAQNSSLSADVIHLEGAAWRINVAGEREPLLSGMTIGAGETVETGPFTFMSLRLEDDTRVVLPSNSAVSFVKEQSPERVRVRLRRGAVESKVVPRPGGEHYEVETPVGIIGVRGTHFRVRRQDNGVSTSVLRGAVAVEQGDALPRVLSAGEGGWLDSAGGLNRALLLPAPTLLPNWRGAGGVLHARVEPIPGAAQYRLQLALDGEFVTPVREATSPDGAFSVEDIPAGAYHIRIYAIDGRGIEGREAHHVFFLRGIGGHR